MKSSTDNIYPPDDNSYEEETKMEKQIPTKKFPRNIIFIIGMEFCERFSYYGFKAVLMMYFLTQLKFHPTDATNYMHAFQAVTYITPIFGAIIADALFGKYTTIWTLSILHAAGNILISISSIPNTIDASIGTLISLIMLAIGTGGIKPCVAAFGGDQFNEKQERQIQVFFSMFYFSINCGSLISMFVTPILRSDVKCFGVDCFPLAFGLPAMLMVIALGLFVMGRFIIGYKMDPPQGAMLLRVMKCIGIALHNKLSNCKHGKKNHEHWLDYAEHKFDRKLIDDIKQVFKVFGIFITLPMYSALYDQQGSKWIIQGARMDGRVTASWTLLPDQMATINSILILLFIPLFELLIYPFFKWCNIATSPLRRMGVGFILQVVCFLIAMIIQFKVNATLPAVMVKGKTNLMIINTTPCLLQVNTHDQLPIIINATEQLSQPVLVNEEEFPLDVHCLDGSGLKANFTSIMKNKKFNTIIIYQSSSKLQYLKVNDPDDKPFDVKTLINVVNLIPLSGDSDNLTVTFKLKADTTVFEFNQSYTSTGFSENGYDIGKYSVDVNAVLGGININQTLNKLYAENGAAWHLILQKDNFGHIAMTKYERFQPNSVSLFWQIPQYFVLTLGEVLVYITGLEFFYSQAPTSMKSLVQSLWLIAVGIGNLIVIIVDAFAIQDMAMEFLLFACLMVLNTVGFVIIAWFYKYRDQQPEESKQAEIVDVKENIVLENGIKL